MQSEDYCIDFEFIIVNVLLVWSWPFHSRIDHSYKNVIIAGEGLQILTYARHSWQLSLKAYLTCHDYCDMGLSCIMVISEEPWYSHLLPSVRQRSCHYLFFKILDLPHARRTLFLYATVVTSRMVWSKKDLIQNGWIPNV